MTASATKWAVYRDRFPLAAPAYLGDVHALTESAAIARAKSAHGPNVIVQRVPAKSAGHGAAATSQQPVAGGRNGEA